MKHSSSGHFPPLFTPPYLILSSLIKPSSSGSFLPHTACFIKPYPNSSLSLAAIPLVPHCVLYSLACGSFLPSWISHAHLAIFFLIKASVFFIWLLLFYSECTALVNLVLFVRIQTLVKWPLLISLKLAFLVIFLPIKLFYFYPDQVSGPSSS